jgi:hypothetical protein
VADMSDIDKLEKSIFAYLKKRYETKKGAGGSVGEIISNCLEGTTYTFPEMYQALKTLRKAKKINWSIKENKYLYREVKNVATGQRKTAKSRTSS